MYLNRPGFVWLERDRYFAVTIIDLTEGNFQAQRVDLRRHTDDVECLHHDEIPSGSNVVKDEFTVSVTYRVAYPVGAVLSY